MTGDNAQPETSLLIVTDVRIHGEGLRAALEAMPGFRVAGVEVGGVSLTEATEKHRPDVLLLDLRGFEPGWAEDLRRAGAGGWQTPVVVLSVPADRSRISRLLEAGARALLSSEAPPEHMAEAIRRAGSGETYLCPRIRKVAVPPRTDEGARRVASSIRQILSEREIEVLQLVAEGFRSRDIAALLDISVKTVDAHRSHLMKKLNAETVAELTRIALQEGLTSLDAGPVE